MKNRAKKNTKLLHYLLLPLTIIAISAAFTSCKLEDPPVLNLSLSLQFISDAQARTLKPDTLNLSVNTYDISGTGPHGETFLVEGIITDAYELDNLVPGDWSVVAKGKNIDSIIIVQSAPTEINLNSGNNNLAIALLPLDGTGTFSLGLSWPADLISTPKITAVLTPDIGEVIPLDFVITGTSAEIVSLSLARGYYELVLKFTDESYDAYLVWSKVETVLMFAGATTSENWVLVATDMNSPAPQNLELTLTSDTKSPIEMVFAGVIPELAYNTDMTVTASGTPEPTSWKWFLDGDVLADQTTLSVTLGAGLAEKTIHALTVIGRKSDAPIIISAVDLKTAGNYVILAQSGVSGNAGTYVVGNIGVSPVTTAAITGFDLIHDDPLGEFSTSILVDGSVFASDHADPTPGNLAQAILDSDAAYDEAATRVSQYVVDDLLGEIGGMTLAPGLYSWGEAVTINTDLILEGPANGVWIFQIAGALTQAAEIKVILSGGALPENIFWQVGGRVGLGANAHMEGVVLSGTGISLGAGATADGRLYAKTAVTLVSSAATQPAN